MPIAVQVTPTTTPTLRLAVLEFETPPNDVFDLHGTYGDIAVKILRRTLASTNDHQSLLKVTKVSVLEGDSWPDLDTVDAVLITGSKYTASDNDVWVSSLIGFIQRSYHARKPVAGICYGHQMIARALGGRTSRNPQGWELSVNRVDLAPQGVDIFGQDRLVGVFVPRVTIKVNGDQHIYQMHRDAVIETPLDVQVIGSSPRCDVQVMYQPGRILGFQGHPEFDMVITESLLKQRLDEGIVENSVYEDAMSRIERKHDGVLITAALCKFLLGPLA